MFQFTLPCRERHNNALIVRARDVSIHAPV